MTVALDTNVLIDLLAGAPEPARRAREALEDASGREAVIISPVVYAELMAYPERTEQVEGVLALARITVMWEMTLDVWRRAGTAYRDYTIRRRRSGGGRPRRILADFLIGAHALDVGALITADPDFFRTNFPALRILVPT